MLLPPLADTADDNVDILERYIGAPPNGDDVVR
jgi:hypothetical protein